MKHIVITGGVRKRDKVERDVRQVWRCEVCGTDKLIPTAAAFEQRRREVMTCEVKCTGRLTYHVYLRTEEVTPLQGKVMLHNGITSTLTGFVATLYEPGITNPCAEVDLPLAEVGPCTCSTWPYCEHNI